MKTCTKCLQEKDEKEFGVHSGSRDGLKYHCRQCCRVASSAHRDANRPWENLRARIAYIKNSDKIKARRRARYYEDKSKSRAQSAAGKLPRQPCTVCGGKGEAHHEDYSKPLDVMWLCRKHHMIHHYGKC